MPRKKKRPSKNAVTLLAEAAQACRQAGLPVDIVSGGGSGTYRISPFVGGLTEIQAGGAIFNDQSYLKWGVQTQPALFVQSMVTSRPAPDRVIFDAGFKALPAWNGRSPAPLGIENIASFGPSAEAWSLASKRS